MCEAERIHTQMSSLFLAKRISRYLDFSQARCFQHSQGSFFLFYLDKTLQVGQKSNNFIVPFSFFTNAFEETGSAITLRSFLSTNGQVLNSCRDEGGVVQLDIILALKITLKLWKSRSVPSSKNVTHRNVWNTNMQKYCGFSSVTKIFNTGWRGLL